MSTLAIPRGVQLPAPERVAQWVVRRGPLHIVVLAIAFVWLLPTLGLLVSSFRDRSAVTFSGWWTAIDNPLDFTIQNYQDVIGAQGMGQAFLNSLYITVPATFLTVAVASFAAYAFAWMKFPLRDVIFLVIVALMVVPIQMTLIPVLKLFSAIGFTGEYWAVWLAHAGYGLPFAVFLLRNFFAALPRDLFDAAFIDGASHWKAYYRIALPLSVPALASLTIFQFLWTWNDLLVALIFLGGSPDKAPMTLVISALVSSLGGRLHLLTAAAFLSMLLPLAIFFALQRYFVRGIMAGSLKGA